MPPAEINQKQIPFHKFHIQSVLLVIWKILFHIITESMNLKFVNILGLFMLTRFSEEMYTR